MSFPDIRDKIKRLKEEKKAVILAHYYQLPEIQEIADYVGDSLALSKLARELPHSMIVFCGVQFMAETAKILSPEKTVLLPVAEAGCPMADMVSANEVINLKNDHPDAAVVAYVNSTTEVKAISDICVTSSNAVDIIRSLPQKKIIFLPDENLGSYAASQIPEKEFVLAKGFCPIHEEVMPIDVNLALIENPDAWFIAHPECRPDVRQMARFIGSTSQLIQYVNNSRHNSFIIGTEMGILQMILKEYPHKKAVAVMANMVCPNMKKTRLIHVYESLINDYFEIRLDPDLIAKARLPLEKMILAVKE